MVGVGTSSVASPDNGVDSLNTGPGRCDLRTAAASSTGVSSALFVEPPCLVSTIAAAPSFGEQSIHKWSGSHTTRDARTDSASTGDWYMASGLLAPCLRFLTTTAARCCFVTPEVCMRR